MANIDQSALYGHFIGFSFMREKATKDGDLKTVRKCARFFKAMIGIFGKDLNSYQMFTVFLWYAEALAACNQRRRALVAVQKSLRTWDRHYRERARANFFDSPDEWAKRDRKVAETLLEELTSESVVSH